MALATAFINGLDESFKDMEVITTDQAAVLDELGDRWELLKPNFSLK